MELKKVDVSKESQGDLDDISNSAKLHMPNLSISEANRIEYGEDEYDLGNESGKKSGLKNKELSRDATVVQKV